MNTFLARGAHHRRGAVPLRRIAMAAAVTSVALPLLSSGPAGAAAAVAAEDPIGGPRLSGLGQIVDLPIGVPAPPIFAAACYLVANADSGDIILAQCPHAPSLPASTMKALTALALVPKLDPNKVVVATNEDASADGTKVGLVPGLPYTVRQLFQGLLMTSGNDAAWALGRTYGTAQTVARMNEIAVELGARDTVAKNPSGLDDPAQVTSAYDLALIGRAALANPDIAAYVSTQRVKFPGKMAVRPTRSRLSYEVANHNKLIANYPGTIGVKNGYTVAAKHTYIGAVKRGSTTYLVTFVANPNPDWRPTAALFDWAFAYGAKLPAVGRLVRPGEVSATPSPSSAASENSAGSSGAPSSASGAAAATTSATSGADGIPILGGAARELSELTRSLPEALRSRTDWLMYGGVAALLVLAGVVRTRVRSSRARRRTRTRYAGRYRR